MPADQHRASDVPAKDRAALAEGRFGLAGRGSLRSPTLDKTFRFALLLVGTRRLFIKFQLRFGITPKDFQSFRIWEVWLVSKDIKKAKRTQNLPWDSL
jgi:hypothetical protein